MAKKVATPAKTVAKPAAKKAAKKATPAPEVKARLIVGDFELGLIYKVTEKTIYNWRREGMPATKLPGNRWQYDLDKTDPWVTNKQDTGDGDPETIKAKRTILKARARRETAIANQAERDDELAEGNVLDRETYELFAAETIQETRDGVLRVPTFFSSHLCKKCQPTIKELKRQLEQALLSLAKLNDGPTVDD